MLFKPAWRTPIANRQHPIAKRFSTKTTSTSSARVRYTLSWDKRCSNLALFVFAHQCSCCIHMSENKQASWIDNNCRLNWRELSLNESYLTPLLSPVAEFLSAQSSAQSTFFQKKYTYAEVLIIQQLPHIIHTYSSFKIINLRHKTTKMPKIRHYYINRGTQKIAAEVAAIAKKYFHQ